MRDHVRKPYKRAAPFASSLGLARVEHDIILALYGLGNIGISGVEIRDVVTRPVIGKRADGISNIWNCLAAVV